MSLPYFNSLLLIIVVCYHLKIFTFLPFYFFTFKKSQKKLAGLEIKS